MNLSYWIRVLCLFRCGYLQTSVATLL